MGEAAENAADLAADAVAGGGGLPPTSVGGVTSTERAAAPGEPMRGRLAVWVWTSGVSSASGATVAALARSRESAEAADHTTSRSAAFASFAVGCFSFFSFLGPLGAFGGLGGSSLRAAWRSRFRRLEFHRFLIALSVRPGSSLTISAHLVPSLGGRGVGRDRAGARKL